MVDYQEYVANFDFVLCIDVSESMHDVLDRVKESALGLYDELKAEVDHWHWCLKETRVKVIAFRDMTIGEENEVSEWFRLPNQNADFKAFLDKLEACGGGDGPETGIDAISLAMMQDWNKAGDRRRHAIVLWTDAPTKWPGEQKMDPGLPRSMPEFVRMWQDPKESIMDYHAKRLFVFAPDDDSWEFVGYLDDASFEEASPDMALDDRIIGHLFYRGLPGPL